MLSFLVGALVSCNNSSETSSGKSLNGNGSDVDGGPCSYNRDTLYCKILAIDTTLEIPEVLSVTYRASTHESDTTKWNYYDMMEDDKSVDELLETPHFVVFEVMEITSGSCNPYMVNMLGSSMDEPTFRKLHRVQL